MTHLLIWAIAIFTTAGIIVRPFKLPEATWAVAASILLVATRLMVPAEAMSGIKKGADVYLFLTGMMLLAEIAREEKLFDWLAAHAIRYANGSPSKLFLSVYLVGTFVTIFLSNDATAVVLTPAVAIAIKSAKSTNPLPYLYICAFIANAASFVLPISNPANLVVYGSMMPPLAQWLSTYLVPSFFAIMTTYIVLKWRMRKEINQEIASTIAVPVLSKGGKAAGIGIIVTGVVLLTASGFSLSLGLPTAIAGTLTATIVLIGVRKKPTLILRRISWSILPLVAGLFIIVEALNKTGLIASIGNLLSVSAAKSGTRTAWVSGSITAFGSNLINNLPSGLMAGHVFQEARVSPLITHFILVGVDLGPNLSVTGSLATLLWLVALRREGMDVSPFTFLKIGVIVMIPALLAAFGALLLTVS